MVGTVSTLSHMIPTISALVSMQHSNTLPNTFVPRHFTSSAASLMDNSQLGRRKRSLYLM